MRRFIIIKEGHFLNGESVYSWKDGTKYIRISPSKISLYKWRDEIIFNYKREGLYLQNRGRDDYGAVLGDYIAGKTDFQTIQKGIYLRVKDWYIISMKEEQNTFAQYK